MGSAGAEANGVENGAVALSPPPSEESSIAGYSTLDALLEVRNHHSAEGVGVWHEPEIAMPTSRLACQHLCRLFVFAFVVGKVPD